MYLFLLYTARPSVNFCVTSFLLLLPRPSYAIEWCVCQVLFSEIFIYRYHLPLCLFFLETNLCFYKESRLRPFLCYRSLSLPFTLLLPSDALPSKLTGGRGRRTLDLPLFSFREGLDSGFRFRFRLIGFHLLSCIEPAFLSFSPSLSLSATRVSSFYAGSFVSLSLLIQSNILCFSTHATPQT